MKNKHTILTVSIIFIMLLTSLSLFAEWQSDNGNGTFKNPVLYADYPDPSMVRVGNDFYLASSTFANVPGLVILKSQDLVNWEIVGHCISSFTSNDAYNLQEEQNMAMVVLLLQLRTRTVRSMWPLRFNGESVPVFIMPVMPLVPGVTTN